MSDTARCWDRFDTADHCVDDLVFPKQIQNRPGLSTIDYRIGTYADIRDAMVRCLDESDVLAGWTHRSPDDPGIALLEAAAVVGDILTFYQQLFANETKLRTAAWRETVADLVQLTGYRLAAGLGGKATVAFDADTDVTISKGFGVRVQLDGVDGPVILETSADLAAQAGLSEFSLYRPLEEPTIDKGTNEFRLVGDTDEIEEATRMLMATRRMDGRLMRPEVLAVEEVRQLHGETIVTTSGSRQKAIPGDTHLVGHPIGRTFRHFGHNSPPTKVTLSGGVASETPVEYDRELTETTEYSDPNLDETEFPLDVEVDDLPVGAQLICHEVDSEEQGGSFTVVRTAASVRNDSITWGALTGGTTLVTLDMPLRLLAEDDGGNGGGGKGKGKGKGGGSKGKSSGGGAAHDIRQFHFHEIVGPKLDVYRAPRETSTTRGRKLFFFGSSGDAAALLGRRLLMSEKGEDSVELAVTSMTVGVSAMTGFTKLHEIELDQELDYDDFSNEPAEDEETPVFYGNVVGANQGETQAEVTLGNGDARVRFQTFKIPKSPLTYHYEKDSTPPQDPEVDIYVEGRAWKHVASLYGQGPEAEVFVVRRGDDGESYVQFGDGERLGARVPSGVGNITAVYRVGTGAHGTLKADTTVQTMERLDGVDGVWLPGVVSGGDEPETPDVARTAAPARLQSLGRLVGLSDFEAEALSISGVTKASARWAIRSGTPGIVLTILMSAGREEEFGTVREILESADRERGADRHSVTVRQGMFAYVHLDVIVGIARGRKQADVIASVHRALGESSEASDGGEGLFGLRARRFGEPCHATTIAARTQQTDGVAWCRVRSVANLGTDLETAAVPTTQSGGRAVIGCDADHVLRLEERPAGDLIRLAPSGEAGGNG